MPDSCRRKTNTLIKNAKEACLAMPLLFKFHTTILSKNIKKVKKIHRNVI